MRRAACLGVLGLLLGGCAGSSGEPPSGRPAVGIIGTPFYALFKGVACVATVTVAAPAAAAMQLTDRRDKEEVRQSLDDGVGRNCGGAWSLPAS
ncbi:hypothetical protein SH611_04930 [Geminicoccaceae bacterium 1502E]|nr:hypothetical protein [Geminicoccaceae bacterium 1502E]